MCMSSLTTLLLCNSAALQTVLDIQDGITERAQQQRRSTACQSWNLNRFLTAVPGPTAFDQDSRVLLQVPPCLAQCLACHLYARAHSSRSGVQHVILQSRESSEFSALPREGRHLLTYRTAWVGVILVLPCPEFIHRFLFRTIVITQVMPS